VEERGATGQWQRAQQTGSGWVGMLGRSRRSRRAVLEREGKESGSGGGREETAKNDSGTVSERCRTTENDSTLATDTGSD